jgi:two-component system KDP operon response regulator KdpE
MSEQLTAVLIEDEAAIRSFLRTALETEEWQVFEADSVTSGVTEAALRKPDLLVVDLGLPDGDGLDLIERVRSRSAVPIIVLSARSDEADKIKALDAGASDYLTKPFGVGEFLARTRVALRHRAGLQEKPQTAITFGTIELDLNARTVRKDGKILHLTPIEYRLLAVMALNAGKVMTHSQLLREVWGPGHADSSHYVRVYMGHLRAKLEKDPAQPQYLLTETAVGYRLNC